MRMLTALLIIAATLLFAGLAPAPPVPKDKPEGEKPETPEMYKAEVKRLQQIALGWHNYHDANGHFPNNVWDAKGEKPILSWRVQILPFIEQNDLYKQFKLDEPWDSDNNKKLLEKMPAIFKSLRNRAKADCTFLQAFAGKGELMKPKGEKVGIVNIADGTSNTFMVAEAGEAVLWTKPVDIQVEAMKEFPKLGGEFKDVFYAALCDGAVCRFKKTTPEEILRPLATIAGGEVVEYNKYTEPAEGPGNDK